MGRYKKCCVSECPSTSETHRLFSIPRNDELRALWLSFLIPTSPLISGLSKEQLIQKCVCHLHFDRQQFNGRGNRLQYGYPCLFTETEIQAGIPLISPVVEHPEHNYCSKLSPSHSSEYEDCKMIVINGEHSEYLSKPAEPCHNDNTNTKNELGDHNYSKPRYSDDTAPELQPDSEINDPTCIKKGDDDLRFNKYHLKPLQEFDDDDDEFDELGFDDPSSEKLLDDIDHCHDENIKTGRDDDVLLVGDDDDEDISPVVDMEADVPVTPEDSSWDGNDHYITEEHPGFRCNVCLGKIVGFRYRCCECVDYDVCSNCESRQQHPQHYILRIPGNREQTEIRRVLAAIRLSLALPADVKDELTIKIEDLEEECPPDPLDIDEADPSVIAPADTKPMEILHTQTLHGCQTLVDSQTLPCETSPPSAKKPRAMPNNKHKPFKIIGANVRLSKLVLPSQEKTKDASQTKSLHDFSQRREPDEPKEQYVDTSQNDAMTIGSESETLQIVQHTPTKIMSLKVSPETSRKFHAEPTDMETNAGTLFKKPEDVEALNTKTDTPLICKDKSFKCYPVVRSKKDP